MRCRKFFSRWIGFLLLAVLWLPQLTTEAQVRVPNSSKNTVPSLSLPSSSFIQSPVDIPKNAYLDYTGHAWECEEGYHRLGKECVVVDMPANATLNDCGTVWECEELREYRVRSPQQNDSKDDIQQIQGRLKKAGFDPGPMDGILGARTMKALRRYLATRQP